MREFSDDSWQPSDQETLDEESDLYAISSKIATAIRELENSTKLRFARSEEARGHALRLMREAESSIDSAIDSL